MSRIDVNVGRFLLGAAPQPQAQNLLQGAVGTAFDVIESIERSRERRAEAAVRERQLEQFDEPDIQGLMEFGISLAGQGKSQEEIFSTLQELGRISPDEGGFSPAMIGTALRRLRTNPAFLQMMAQAVEARKAEEALKPQRFPAAPAPGILGTIKEIPGALLEQFGLSEEEAAARTKAVFRGLKSEIDTRLIAPVKDILGQATLDPEENLLVKNILRDFGKVKTTVSEAAKKVSLRPEENPLAANIMRDFNKIGETFSTVMEEAGPTARAMLQGLQSEFEALRNRASEVVPKATFAGARAAIPALGMPAAPQAGLGAALGAASVVPGIQEAAAIRQGLQDFGNMLARLQSEVNTFSQRLRESEEQFFGE